jgi:hypothetical protein
VLESPFRETAFLKEFDGVNAEKSPTLGLVVLFKAII